MAIGSRPSLLLTLVAGLLGLGCAGAHYDVKADSARYPISLSPSLPDSSGNVLYLGEELESRGTFTVEGTELGVFYNATGGTVDLSEDVNREVKRRGGEGVVALSVTTSHCALNWLFPLTLLPIWPGCQGVEVKGTVVRRRADLRAANDGGAR